MSTTENFLIQSNTKIDRYIDLIHNRKSLVNSSKSIIRKRRSPLAREISAGDINSIIKAAKSRVYGSISKEDRERLCRILCDMKAKLKNRVTGETTREIISWAVAGIIGIVDAASGLVISLLWIIREKIDHVICKCKLNGDCINNNCLRHI